MVAFAEGVIPRKENITGILRGLTLRRKILLFKDKAESEPFDFTGWTVKLVTDAGLTLTEGHGLTVTAGQILIALTAAETAALPLGAENYRVLMEEGTTEDICPVRGAWATEDP